MKDAFDRTIEYMRISITDRCNLRCKYCMPDPLPDIPHPSILRYEEIQRVCASAIPLGVRHFRVTGGEPLVRRGCVDFLRALKALPDVGEVMLTTNGILLESHVPTLRAIGIDGVNISLDTLDRGIYQDLSGFDGLDQVLSAIKAAVGAGLRVKLNCVAMQGVNNQSIGPIAALAEAYPLDVRFIESMPIGAGAGFAPIPEDTLHDILEAQYPGLAETGERRGFGPARYFQHPRLQGRIGFISALSHGFCGQCNRIRLTSDGFLKTCLYFGEATDLKPLLRAQAQDSDLAEAMQKAIAGKQEKHLFLEARSDERRNMSKIGG